MVGGGPAGVEIALALRARLDRTGPHETAPWIGLAAGSGLVPTLNARARGKVRAALARRQIEVFAPCRIAQVGPQGAQDDSGRWIASDLTIVSTAARGPSWLAATDLPLAPDASVLVGPTLASLGDDAIFAAGDCAEVAGERREKAGVFAVRQGPPLALNLRRRVRREPGADYRAQRAFLTILSTGDGSAIAARGRWFAMEGRWVWWWKDRIDRAFVSRFNAK
ncbi:MAG: selenide water dikinase [Xanthobacteraceae bacterium]|nr:MAG: selenide water dikinase [Xanthobacteraceae bacterium]